MKDDEVYEATREVLYFIKSCAQHETEKSGKKMVEVHVEMFLEYKTISATPLVERSSYIYSLDKTQELALSNMR